MLQFRVRDYFLKVKLCSGLFIHGSKTSVYCLLSIVFVSIILGVLREIKHLLHITICIQYIFLYQHYALDFNLCSFNRCYFSFYNVAV